jgi:hypothetical protein
MPIIQGTAGNTGWRIADPISKITKKQKELGGVSSAKASMRP